MNNKPVYITLFYCSNSIHHNELSNLGRDIEGINFKTINLPCSGKANLLYLLKSVETGANGVILIACKHGECHYLEGNFRAQKRVEAVNSVLEEAGIGKNRIIALQAKEKNNSKFIINDIKDFCNKIRKLHNSQIVKA